MRPMEARFAKGLGGWLWGGQDSNLRRLRRRFYRPLPLAARAPPQLTPRLQ